jgi:hypothetical protein
MKNRGGSGFSTVRTPHGRSLKFGQHAEGDQVAVELPVLRSRCAKPVSVLCRSSLLILFPPRLSRFYQ